MHLARCDEFVVHSVVDKRASGQSACAYLVAQYFDHLLHLIFMALFKCVSRRR